MVGINVRSYFVVVIVPSKPIEFWIVVLLIIHDYMFNHQDNTTSLLICFVGVDNGLTIIVRDISM